MIELSRDYDRRAMAADPLRSTATKKTWKKDEFIALVESRSSLADQGLDPTHLALQKLWFISLAQFAGVSAIEHLGDLANVDPTFVAQIQGLKANKILPLVQKQVSRMVKADPVFDVVPRSPDPDDQFGAKVAKWMLEHIAKRHGSRLKRQEAAYWLAITGNAFWLVDWDAMAGSEIETVLNPYTREPQRADAVSPEMRLFAKQAGAIQTRFEGDIDQAVLSPFQVIRPSGFRDIDSSPWVLLEYEKSLDWVCDRYPKARKNITEHDLEDSADANYWRRLSRLAARYGFSLHSGANESNETVLVREFWMRPSTRFPNGLWGRTLRRTHLDHGPHPLHAAGIDLRAFPFLGLPVEHFRYIPMPGRFWGMGMVEHLLALQIDYDRSRDQLTRQRDILAHPQLMAPREANLTSTRNEYGDILEYDMSAGGKPEILSAPNVSPIMVESMNRTIGDMQLIASQNDATQGDVPTGLRSGLGIRHLQEQDLAAMGPVYEQLETSLEQVAKRQLILLHEFMDVPSAVAIYGEYRMADIRIFSGGDLAGNINVQVRRGSTYPRSSVETAELMMGMAQAGAVNLTNPDEKEMFFRALEVGGADHLFYRRAASRRRAEIENEMFMRPQVDQMTGQPQPFPDVADHDDHSAHLATHLELMHSDAYETLPVMRKMAFEAHKMKHEAAIMQQLQAMQSMQAPAGAGSPAKEPGQASPPAEKKDTPGSTKGVA